MRTERNARSIGIGTNALASSIVLVCRKRETTAQTIDKKRFVRTLRSELPLRIDLMINGTADDTDRFGQSAIAPVDLAQAMIGPGMEIYSRYAAILEDDGSPLPVRTALALINSIIDEFFNQSEGALDGDTRFCLAWFEECGWTEGEFGRADTLARAKNTSVDGLATAGVLVSKKGRVRLLARDEYPADWDPKNDSRTPVWEALHQMIRALYTGGEAAAGQLLRAMPDKADAIRQLAYRLYTLCERKGWAEDARSYNELVIAWDGVRRHSADPGASEQELF